MSRYIYTPCLPGAPAFTPSGRVTVGTPQTPGSVEYREKGALAGGVCSVLFFLQEPSSKSFKTESGILGSSPSSDLRPVPSLPPSLGLNLPICKTNGVDFRMATVPSGSNILRAKGTSTQAEGLLCLRNLGQERIRKLSAAQPE